MYCVFLILVIVQVCNCIWWVELQASYFDHVHLFLCVQARQKIVNFLI